MTAHAAAKPLLHPSLSGRTATAMSDYWVLAAFCLALLFIADPLGWRLERILQTKYLPLMLALAGILFANVGLVLFPPYHTPEASVLAPGQSRWRVLAAGWPLFVLGAWILAGSWYARRYGGIPNTFLGMGIYMLFALLVARLVMITPARERIVRGYLLAAAVAAAYMILRMAVATFSYHEMEALTIPLAVYFVLRPTRHPGRQTLIAAFFLIGGLVYQKNTAYLVMLLTALYLWWVHWRFRFVESPGFRRTAVAWLAVLVMAGSAVVSYRAYLAGEWFPSGNPQYRLKTYQTAWNNFQKSPVWGTAFTGSATARFKDFEINVAGGVLPSHSDVLDIAAHGGTLALLLWLWAYLRIGRLAWRNVLRHRPPDALAAAAHTLACMSLTGILVYAFNPIMLQPVKAMLLWGQLGMLLGIALYRAETPPPLQSPSPMGPKVRHGGGRGGGGDGRRGGPADRPAGNAGTVPKWGTP